MALGSYFYVDSPTLKQAVQSTWAGSVKETTAASHWVGLAGASRPSPTQIRGPYGGAGDERLNIDERCRCAYCHSGTHAKLVMVIPLIFTQRL